MSETSSWLTPDTTLEPRPGAPPRMAKLPPGVVRARPVGAPEPEPEPVEVAPAAPTMEPLTPDERRQRIAVAREASISADAVADAAAAALRRAEQHVAVCAAELEAFADVDEQLKQAHVAALRATENRPRVDVTDELRARITARDAARIAVAAAEAALEPFQREAVVARDAANAARLKLSNAVDDLVAVHAVMLLRQRNELARQLDAIEADVLAFEQHAGRSAPRQIGEFVLSLYGTKQARVALLDPRKWRALHARLTADASAELTLSPPAVAVPKAA